MMTDLCRPLDLPPSGVLAACASSRSRSASDKPPSPSAPICRKLRRERPEHNAGARSDVEWMRSKRDSHAGAMNLRRPISLVALRASLPNRRPCGAGGIEVLHLARFYYLLRRLLQLDAERLVFIGIGIFHPLLG